MSTLTRRTPPWTAGSSRPRYASSPGPIRATGPRPRGNVRELDTVDPRAVGGEPFTSQQAPAVGGGNTAGACLVGPTWSRREVVRTPAQEGGAGAALIRKHRLASDNGRPRRLVWAGDASARWRPAGAMPPSGFGPTFALATATGSQTGVDVDLAEPGRVMQSAGLDHSSPLTALMPPMTARGRNVVPVHLRLWHSCGPRHLRTRIRSGTLPECSPGSSSQTLVPSWRGSAFRSSSSSTSALHFSARCAPTVDRGSIRSARWSPPTVCTRSSSPDPSWLTSAVTPGTPSIRRPFRRRGRTTPST